MTSQGSARQFHTGATRDTAEGKPDYEAFLSPLVVYAYGIHMKRHMRQSDGVLRDSDNWQKGIPLDAYVKSMWRHFFDVWANHRHWRRVRKERMVTALCALLFNVMGYLHEYIKANMEVLDDFEQDAP